MITEKQIAICKKAIRDISTLLYDSGSYLAPGNDHIEYIGRELIALANNCEPDQVAVEIRKGEAA